VTPTHDRLSGGVGAPEDGWTGRWAEGATHLLDPATGSDRRDAAESDDLDAVVSLEANLVAAVGSGSWLAVTDVPLLAGHDDDALQVQLREQILQANVASIARVCDRFITRLGERSELLPVSRVKKPARQALERLSAHTEDWAARTLSGPVPRRALAVTREEDADLYENRMVTELVHPILTTALSDRIRRLRRLTSDLADLERARDEGTHYRRRRLYTFWGADAARAAESSSHATQTLKQLESLAAWAQSLRRSTLAVALRGRRTGQRSLRNTNVIANDRHYRAAGLVWAAYEREPEADESPEDRHRRFRSRHRAFDDYVLCLIVRALGDLGYIPQEDEIPDGRRSIIVNGAWGDATIERAPDGAITLTSHHRSSRFVPLVDVVGPADEHPAIAERWASLVYAVREPSVVVYLASSAAMRNLPRDLASRMLSAGPDQVDRDVPIAGVPVSPLETTSLERVARAVADALQSPALLDYPRAVLMRGDRVPRRLIDYLVSSDLTQRGLSPLFYRSGTDTISVRRPLSSSESSSLEAVVRQLKDRTRAPGWERDLAAEIASLDSAIESAAASLAGLLTCPLCGARADTSQVGRDADVFVITCRSCEGRWGHESCGECRTRIPIIEPERDLRNPDAVGPGWVERIYGQDALSSPCWARTVAGRYVCPECRSCSLSAAAEGANCVRCHSDTGPLPPHSLRATGSD
jgi:hypothetical protein